jgi:hypothetical protein
MMIPSRHTVISAARATTNFLAFELWAATTGFTGRDYCAPAMARFNRNVQEQDTKIAC